MASKFTELAIQHGRPHLGVQRRAWLTSSACMPHQVSDNLDDKPGIVAVNVMPGVRRYHVCAVR
jgi:hypothetical protein